MILYKETLEKRLKTVEKDALSDTNFISSYATGRLLGMLEAAEHSGNQALIDKIETVVNTVNFIQTKEQA